MTQLVMPWRLDEPEVSPHAFFALVGEHFAGATHLYIEGCALAPDVEEFYLSNNEIDEFVPGANTNHVFIYRGPEPLLYWHDALANQLWLGHRCSLDQVAVFAWLTPVSVALRSWLFSHWRQLLSLPNGIPPRQRATSLATAWE